MGLADSLGLVKGVVSPPIDVELEDLPVAIVSPLDKGIGIKLSSSGDGGQGMNAGSAGSGVDGFCRPCCARALQSASPR
jgi:hypothetical protein